METVFPEAILSFAASPFLDRKSAEPRLPKMPKLIAGAVVDMAEEAISDHSGIEYVITTHHGQTLTIVQNYVQGDPSIKIGARVMIQTSLTICIGSACSEAVMNGRYFWSCAARTAI